MSTLVVTDLVKSFASHKIIDSVNFTAQPGNVVALLGSSGCGKSTLLRCINQLEVPEEGSIQLGDILLQFPCKQNKAYHKTVYQLRRRIGMVFQQFNLWPHRTVLQNLLEAPLRILETSRDELYAEAIHLLEKVGLIEKKDVYPIYLSGGQQQRVAIARALMMKPELMLFDEPTSALDPEMSREVLAIMQQLVNEGMMLLIATHEIGFAREVATHLMFLDRGKVLEFGLASEVFAQPTTERFREFLKSESKSGAIQ